MTDTATPETGPVDAPASLESVMAEFEAGGEGPGDAVEAVTQELVNEAEGKGDSEQEPATEDDATNDEAKEPEESNPDEQTYTVKVNGEERAVPLSELLNGYSRTEDYKAKTMAVAEERRALEAEKAQVTTAVQAEYASQLETATNLFAEFDPILAEARTINWEALKATDPAAYLQAQDAVQARLAAIQQMQGKVQELRGQTQAQQQQMAEQERASRFDKAAEKIVSEMPELADEAKFQAFATETVNYMREQGFAGPEIADFLDDRVLKVADKARKWDAHVAAQKSLPDKRVVPKSAVKALTTDGTASRANPPRFNANASRESKANWVVNQLLSEE